MILKCNFLYRTKPLKLQENEESGEAERPLSETTKERKSAETTLVLPDKDVALYEKDLLRMMGEVNFINGEVCYKQYVYY